MATSHESRNRSKDIVWTPLGEQVKRWTKIAGVTAVAATAAIWTITHETTGDTVNASAAHNLEAMDKDIEHELHKGPRGKDTVLGTFTIGPSDTVANAMIREDERAHIGQSILQLKATTASANNFNPEGIVQTGDRIVMWNDAELSAEYGRSALLAVPVERPEF